MISSASVFATWRSASGSVWTSCFIVNATSACPIRLLSAFQSILASRPGVPHVVQVDLRSASRRGQLLEPPGDRVRVRRPAVLPAEQHAMKAIRPRALQESLKLGDCPDLRALARHPGQTVMLD
jgi:hypothetical protein